MTTNPLEFLHGRLRILDQTLLPHKIVWIETADYRDVVIAIKTLQVRGAPAIGVAAGYGIALGAQQIVAASSGDFLKELNIICDIFAASRPTAVNLFKSIERMKNAARHLSDVAGIKETLIILAQNIHNEEEVACKRLSRFGADLIEDHSTILTHCNTGALATAAYGTALGVIKAAWHQGKKIEVLATETRPLLQGARLTAWELIQEKVPVTLITDSMAGHFMSKGKVNLVIVGADRIAANGDFANKIGTYTLAVLAAENGIPFYVAAPVSTLDLTLKSGAGITVEQRDPLEVSHIQGTPIAPEGVAILNPSFDITSHRYVRAIITDAGVFTEPYEDRFKSIVKGADVG